MDEIIPLDMSFSVTDPEGSGMALESFSLGASDKGPSITPVSIVAEGGIHYVDIFACCMPNSGIWTKRLCIWLQTLDASHHIRLSVSVAERPICLQEMLTLLGALMNTKATVTVLLDRIVMDEVAYFYLALDHVEVTEAYSVLIPSYLTTRRDDMSAPDKVVLDFYRGIVDRAVVTGKLTEVNANLLHGGSSIIVESSRFG
jgi:hypothetical protein